MLLGGVCLSGAWVGSSEDGPGRGIGLVRRGRELQ